MFATPDVDDVVHLAREGDATLDVEEPSERLQPAAVWPSAVERQVPVARPPDLAGERLQQDVVALGAGFQARRRMRTVPATRRATGALPV